jgi:hypothetical protein
VLSEANSKRNDTTQRLKAGDRRRTEVMTILPYLSYLTVRSSDIPSILWPLTGQYTL